MNLAVFAAIVWCLAGFGSSAATSAELPGLVAKYRQTGLPWLAGDIVSPAVPDSENAAFELRRAWSDLDRKRLGSDYPKIRSLVDGSHFDEAAKALVRYRSCFGLLKRATLRPRIDSHSDWDLGPALGFPDAFLGQEMAGCLLDQAEVYSARGHADQAADCLRTARRLGALVGQEPAIEPLVAQIRIEHDACRSALRCVELLGRKGGNAAAIVRVFVEGIKLPSLGNLCRGLAYLDVAYARNRALFGETAPSGRAGLESPGIDITRLTRGGSPEDATNKRLLCSALVRWTTLSPVIRAGEREPASLGKALDKVLRQMPDSAPPELSSSSVQFERLGASLARLQALESKTLASLRARLG